MKNVIYSSFKLVNQTNNNLYKLFIIMALIVINSNIVNAQTINLFFQPGGFDNCANPLPNAGAYNASGTMNGKTMYVKGAFSRVVWSGTQWEAQFDDNTIPGVNFLTCWFNTNNTTIPPADCWQASFGCFPIGFSGAVAPAVSAVTITKSINNKAAGATATWVMTTTGTIGTLSASNFTLTTTSMYVGE